MPEQPGRDDEQLDRQLSELDANPAAPVDSTVRQLHTELETLAKCLKESVPPDPHEAESGCRRAVEGAKALAMEMTAGLSGEASSAAPMPERFDHFRVLKLLGQGGMGAVYLAEDTRLGREVALKTMRRELARKPEAKARFLREARLAAAVDHDHIVPIYHVGEADGVPFLAMPVLKGRSLDDLLKRTPKLSASQVVRLGRQIAEGLAAAHERGLIHRDVKPANIWIEPTGGGRVKLLDFGLARLDAESQHLTQSGAIVGTPAYMAPEQAKGEKVDARVDLYSLGVVLYRAATGRLPLSGNDTMSLLMALATETPRPACDVNPDVPQPLSTLIMRLLAKDRNERPASAREVIAALAEVEQSVQLPKAADATLPELSQAAPGLQTTVELPPAASARRSRFRLGWAMAAAVLLALLALGYFFGGTVIRYATNQGELVVEVDDPAVEVKIVQNGVVVQDKTSKREFTLTAGKGQIEVLEKDGLKLATRQFELTRGGKTTVRVTFQELADARRPKIDPESEPRPLGSGDPDRRAAEWVLSIGGAIKFKENGTERRIEAVGDLPRGAFELTEVSLRENPKVSDAGLAHFKECKNLTVLGLNNTQVSDAGLAHFKECKNLTVLGLNNTQVSDAGLAHFKDCKNLTHLDLRNTRVSDAGLAHFKECKNLTHLDLRNTRVSDAGLVDLASLPRLEGLILDNTRISLHGYEQLMTTMPRCQITWSEPNRSVAESVLALGGTVAIDLRDGPESRPVKAVADLPRDGFQVRRVSLAGVAKPLDKLLEHLSWLRFPKFDRLESIDLSGVKLPDYGFLAPIHGLRELTLANAGLNDLRLAQLPKLPALKRLVLDGNDIRGTGLRSLKEQPELTDLSLGCPTLGDLFAENLAELKQVKRLSLAGSSLSDAGIKHLEGLANLTELDLRGTKVSAAGVASLRRALPKCDVKWDGAEK